MRIATLNIWGTAADWPARLAALAARWPAIDADVLALQEVERDHAGSQTAQLAETLGYPHAIEVDGHLSGEVGEGLALLSRTPIERSLSWPLPASQPTRRALVAEIATPRGPLTVVNAHTVAVPADARDRQIAALLARPERPLVIAADLNAEPTEIAGQLAATGLLDPHADPRTDRPTWPLEPHLFAQVWEQRNGRKPHFPLRRKRIDYLLTAALDVTAAAIDPVAARDGSFASDHALAWIDCDPAPAG